MGHPKHGPWHFSEEEIHFSRILEGQVIVVDEDTWRRAPERFRDCPRIAIVGDGMSDTETPLQTAFFKTFEEALAWAGNDAWVTGNAALVATALPLAEWCVVMDVDLDLDGGAAAPSFALREWTIVLREGRQDKNGVRYTIITRFRRLPAGDKVDDFELIASDQDG